MKPTFTPTEHMKDATRALTLAMAAVATIRPIVIEYQKRILAEMKPRVKPKWERSFPDIIITDPKHAYLMEDDAFIIYAARNHEEAIKAGLQPLDPDKCPLLVAEGLVRNAERDLLDAMEPVTKMKSITVLSHSLDAHKKMVDLTLRLMVPFIKDYRPRL